MHKRNRLYVTIGLLYGLAGGLLMLVRLVDPALLPGYATRVHAHMMLLGFVLMTIYGVGLHVIPRFTGNPIRGGTLSWLQLSALHVGLAAFVLGTWLPEAHVAFAGGALMWASFLIFAARLGPVLWPHSAECAMRHA